MTTNEPVTPETLTDHAIRMRRANLTLKIVEMNRERYDCVLALGGDAMHEDASARDSDARQRICDAIKAGRVIATIALMLTSCATPAITGDSDQESSAGVCGEPPLRCNPDDPAAQQRCQEVCSEEGGDGFCPPFTTTEIVYCATHCRPDGTTSDPRRCNLLNCDDPIVQHTCTFGSRP